MTDDRIFNVLFLCTGNSSRSIIVEALLNGTGGHRFRAYSAGSHPTGSVHPLAIEQVERLRFSTADLRSKSWDEFGTPDAPHMDFVITVCDKAAGEPCPHWPGHPTTAHWGSEDPAQVTGTDGEKREAFARTFQQIRRRLEQLVMLPLDWMDDDKVRTEAMRVIAATKL